MNVREFERHAQLMLSKNAFDYYASGANDMVTLRENRHVEADESQDKLVEEMASPLRSAPAAARRLQVGLLTCSSFNSSVFVLRSVGD